MGGAPESSNQQTEPNVASDAFNFLGPREPVPRAPQMQSKPAQVAAGIYNGAIAPTLDYMASPMGLATAAVPFAGQIPARLTQAAFVPTLAKGAYESGKETQKALNDPQSTTQDIATAASATVGQGAGALMGYKGALESGAGKYLPNKGESGSVGLGSPSSRMKESINAIDEGLEEKPATPLAQYPTSEQGFYSQLQKVLHEKMPNNASVDQIRAIVDPAKGSGVKPDEIKWSNLEGFLEGKKSVTKQEVLDYLKNEGSVKFEERTLGEPMAQQAERDSSVIAEKYGYTSEYDQQAEEYIFKDKNGEDVDFQDLPSKMQVELVENTNKLDRQKADSSENASSLIEGLSGKRVYDKKTFRYKWEPKLHKIDGSKFLETYEFGKVDRSQQSGSFYGTISLNIPPDKYNEVERNLGSMVDDLDLEKDEDTGLGTITFRYRVSDHGVPESSRSYANLDIRVDPKKYGPFEQKTYRYGGKTKIDTPDAVYPTWMDAAKNIVTEARKMAGDISFMPSSKVDEAY